MCHSRDIQILISLDFAFFFSKSTISCPDEKIQNNKIAPNLDLNKITKNVRHDFGKYP